MKNKKNLSKKDLNDWKEYLKNPKDLIDKDSQSNSTNTNKGRFTFDLHGYSIENANKKVEELIFDCHRNGYKEILVITGKGKNSDPGYVIPKRNGVLRSQVPLWLKEPRLSTLILQVEKAHQRHGGYGALYIYLRRSRS